MSQNYLSQMEAIEIEKFRHRRNAWRTAEQLPIMNIHNVPDQFPTLYKRIFATGMNANDLFCMKSPRYCDAKQDVVDLYESCLKDGYQVY